LWALAAAVNRALDEPALQAVRQSAGHGVPLGTDGWKAKIALGRPGDHPAPPRATAKTA